MNARFFLRVIRIFLFFSLWGAFLGATPAHAAVTFTVNSTLDAVDANLGDGLCADAAGNCTLRAAIMEANARPAADNTINLPAGTYTLTIPGILEDGSATGDLDITGNLKLLGAGAGLTIIDGNNLDVVIHVVESHAVVTISGVTITGGYGESLDNHSSGIHNWGKLNLSDSTLSGNNGLFGTVTNHETITITNSTFSDNISVQGGALHNGFTMTVMSSLIISNTVGESPGGGIFNHGMLTVMDSTITGNTARRGGGIYNWFGLEMPGGEIHKHGHMMLLNSVVSGNLATFSGGGVYNSGTMTVTNTTVSGNTGEGGGGIDNSDSSLVINNSTITDNTATDRGSGGIEVISGTVTIQNSLLAGNTSPFGGVDCSGTVTSFGYNLMGNNDGCDFVATTGDQVGTPANPIDPLLGPLQDNGGPTHTHALLAGSPAIDAANPAGCTDEMGNLLTTDQRSFPRPTDGDGDASAVCDIGGYELEEAPQGPGTLQGTVTNAFTGNPISGAGVSAGFFIDLTDASGFYQFTDLTPGTYNVTASATGYSPSTVTGVVIAPGSTTVQNLALWPKCTSSCLRSTSVTIRVTPTGLSGRVTVKDESGVAVSGAAVSVTWTLPDGSTLDQRRNTNLAGVASFKVADAGPGTYTLTLTNITKTGYTFDPANSMLSASITK